MERFPKVLAVPDGACPIKASECFSAGRVSTSRPIERRRRLLGVVLAVFAGACKFIGGQMGRSVGIRVKSLYGGATVRSARLYRRNLPV